MPPNNSFFQTGIGPTMPFLSGIKGGLNLATPDTSGGIDAGNTKNLVQALMAGNLAGVNRYGPLQVRGPVQRLFQELSQTGTVSDEALAQAASVRGRLRDRGLYSHEAIDAMSKTMGALVAKLRKARDEGLLTPMAGAKELPTFAGQITAAKRPDTMSLADYMRQQVYNVGLNYLDPTSRAATARYLSTSSPQLYGDYEQTFTEGSAPTAATDTAQAMRQAAERTRQAAEAFTLPTIAQTFDPNSRVQAILGSIGGTGLPTGRQDLEAGLGWMRRYLNEAAGAMGPDSTRQDRLRAQERLQTLEREAQEGPAAQFMTLAENITNPVTQTAQLEGIFDRRALQRKSGDYKRGGVAYRNVGAL